MFQKTVAFTVRTFRQESRLITVGLARLAMLGVTIFVIYLLKSDINRIAAPGRELLGIISAINLFAIGILGVSYFPSVITEEKEGQTIGLLLMTGVTPVSMMLGKSLPKQFNAIILLTLQFPFTFLAITLGGVTSDQVLAVYFTQIVTLLAVANLGLVSSVVAKTSFSASVISGCVITGILFGKEFCRELRFMIRSGPWRASFLREIEEVFGFFSPIDHFEFIYRSGANISPVGTYFYTYLIMSILFFILARILFPWFVKGDVSDHQVLFRHRIKSFFSKKKISNHTRKAVRVKGYPFLWKDFQFQAGGKRTWRKKYIFYLIPVIPIIIITIFTAISYYVTPYRSGRYFFELPLVMVLFGSICVVGMESVYHISNIFSQEIKANTFSLLYMIPGSQWKKVYGKTAGNLMGLVPAVSYLSLSFLLLVVFNYLTGRNSNVFEDLVREIIKGMQEPEFWMGTFVVIFFIHFLMIMTLYLGRAAIPVSLITSFALAPAIYNLFELYYRYSGAFLYFNLTRNYTLFYDAVYSATAWFFLIASLIIHFVIIPLRMKQLAASGG